MTRHDRYTAVPAWRATRNIARPTYRAPNRFDATPWLRRLAVVVAILATVRLLGV